MLSPLSITRGLVVYTGEEMKIFDWHLCCLDTELMIKLALGGSLDSHNRFRKLSTTFSWNTKRVGAAGVGPHVWECDLFCGPLLKEKFILGIKEEDGECAMEETFVDVGHQVA